MFAGVSKERIQQRWKERNDLPIRFQGVRGLLITKWIGNARIEHHAHIHQIGTCRGDDFKETNQVGQLFKRNTKTQSVRRLKMITGFEEMINTLLLLIQNVVSEVSFGKHWKAGKSKLLWSRINILRDENISKFSKLLKMKEFTIFFRSSQ